MYVHLLGWTCQFCACACAKSTQRRRRRRSRQNRRSVGSSSPPSDPGLISDTAETELTFHSEVKRALIANRLRIERFSPARQCSCGPKAIAKVISLTKFFGNNLWNSSGPRNFSVVVFAVFSFRLPVVIYQPTAPRWLLLPAAGQPACLPCFWPFCDLAVSDRLQSFEFSSCW